MATSELEKIDRGTTLMEIGQHCAVCHDIDFLPFKCDLCGVNFCSQHKDQLASHECTQKKKEAKTAAKELNKTLPSTASVFPNLKAIRQQTPPAVKPTSIKDKLLADSKSLDSKISEGALQALEKLKKFMSVSTKTKVSPSQKIIETAKLKNTAKGETKIPESERIYVWVEYVDKKSDKVAMYVSRAWPIGRMLDAASAQLRIKNENNRTTDPSKRLTIFRRKRVGESEDYIYVPANGRVSKEIVTGDHVYLVRGASV